MIGICNCGGNAQPFTEFQLGLAANRFQACSFNPPAARGPRSCPCEAPGHPPGGTCTSQNGPWSHDGVERSHEEICHLIPGLPKSLLSNTVMLELYCCKSD